MYAMLILPSSVLTIQRRATFRGKRASRMRRVTEVTLVRILLQRTMRTRFCAEVCPDTISTLLLGTPKYSDNTRQTSMLALPFSGTACTLTRSTPFSVLPATSLTAERGMTLTLMMNESGDNLIHQFVQLAQLAAKHLPFQILSGYESGGP